MEEKMFCEEWAENKFNDDLKEWFPKYKEYEKKGFKIEADLSLIHILPHGVTGLGIPIGDLPSPPPCGWSFGFITTPRTVGLQPI